MTVSTINHRHGQQQNAEAVNRCGSTARLDEPTAIRFYVIRPQHSAQFVPYNDHEHCCHGLAKTGWLTAWLLPPIKPLAYPIAPMPC